MEMDWGSSMARPSGDGGGDRYDDGAGDDLLLEYRRQRSVVHSRRYGRTRSVSSSGSSSGSEDGWRRGRSSEARRRKHRKKKKKKKKKKSSKRTRRRRHRSESSSSSDSDSDSDRSSISGADRKHARRRRGSSRSLSRSPEYERRRHHRRRRRGSHRSRSRSRSRSRGEEDYGDYSSYQERDDEGAMLSPRGGPTTDPSGRRLYVGGSVLSTTTVDDLRSFLDDAMGRALHLPPPPPVGLVSSVYLNSARMFAFVEVWSDELAAAYLQLDGILFQGHPLRIRRPSDYQPTANGTDMEPLDVDVTAVGLSPPTTNTTATGAITSTSSTSSSSQRGAAGIASVVPDGPNKVFIGGLPYHLTEAEVLSLLSPFGTLRAFHLVTEVPCTQQHQHPQQGGSGSSGFRGSRTNRGFAFCEFEDPSNGITAVQTLNGLPMGGNRVLSLRMGISRHDGHHKAAAARPATGPTAATTTRQSQPAATAPLDTSALLQQLAAAVSNTSSSGNNTSNDASSWQQQQQQAVLLGSALLAAAAGPPKQYIPSAAGPTGAGLLRSYPSTTTATTRPPQQQAWHGAGAGQQQKNQQQQT